MFDACVSLSNVCFAKDSKLLSIGENAFERCESLASIKLPDSVTSIGKYAFSRCTSLQMVVVPKSVTFIDSYVFSGCRSLTIYCEAEFQPDEWDSAWNSSIYPVVVVWGYTGEESE